MLLRYPGILSLLFSFVPCLVTAQEVVRPSAPYIKRVTVDTATNDTHIYWALSSSPNVEKYIIYEETGIGGIALDTLDAPSDHYIHVGSGAGTGRKLYSVAAMDSLKNISTREDYPKHSTVYLSCVYDSCNNRIILKWNNYIGWAENIAGYRLFRSRNMSGYSTLAGLSSDTVFIDNGTEEQGITENASYAYYVVALKNDGLESFSNICRKYTYMPGPPENLVMEYVNVQEKNMVELSFSYTDTSSINDFTLLRSGESDADFIKVKTVKNVNEQPVKLVDFIITGREMYYYKIGALNSCMRVIKESNLGVNILLQGSSSGTDVQLQWNPYDEYLNGIQEYVVYRGLSGEELVNHASVSHSVTSFLDDINDISGRQSPGEIIYKIGVIENVTGTIAYSNEIVIPVESEIFVPNAFTPDGDGVNDIFIPVMNFIPEEYTMIIYDRSGIEVFRTDKPEEGWDGNINGTKAAEGVYLFFIEYKSFNGIRQTKKPGSVTLFYPR